MTEYKYIPGVCNIGPAEIQKRRQIGILWSIVSIALFVILFLLNLPTWTRLFIFLPTIVAFSGWYQAIFHFCAGYGNKGLYNVAKSVGKSDTVEQAEFRKIDKKKAQQILTLSIVSAAIVSIILYFI
jgi:hypothetical protein